MGGGVSPYEWILPPVAASHAIYNAGAQQVSPRLKAVTPGSKSDKENTLNEEAIKRADAEQAGMQARIDALPHAQTPEAGEEARRRAVAASESLGGQRRRRASSTLTDPGRLLSGSDAMSYGP